MAKANVSNALARQLLGTAATPEAPATAAQAAGERRRGRPAGVANTPREPQQRAQGNISVPQAIADRELGNGFTNLPRNDFRRLNVGDAVAVPRAGDRGAAGALATATHRCNPPALVFGMSMANPIVADAVQA
jgi:hypothetical protein